MRDAHDRLSVPAAFVDFGSGRVGDTEVLREFFVRLKRVPLSAWIGAAVPLADAPGAVDEFESPETAAARARLRAIVDRMPAGLALAKQRVNDLVAVAEGFAAHAVVSRMKRVALTAALALMARPHLGEADFARLYAPFQPLIPADQLPRARG